MQKKDKKVASHCFKCGANYETRGFNFCPSCGHELSKLKENVFSELMNTERNWEAIAINMKDEIVFELGVFHGLVEDIAMKFSNCNFLLKLIPADEAVTVDVKKHGYCTNIAIDDKRLRDVPVGDVENLLEAMSSKSTKYYKMSTGIGDTVICFSKSDNTELAMEAK